jgi:hypothetical protein
LLEKGLEEGSNLLERDLVVQDVPLGLEDDRGRGELEADGTRQIFDHGR